MTATRRAYGFVLKDGTEVVLAEITPSEMFLAAQAAGAEDVASVRGLKVTREALRFSVREVNGRKVSQMDLEGEGWSKHLPRTRHIMELADLWSRIHLPTEAEMAAVEQSMACASGLDGESWTLQVKVKHLDGSDTVRTVVMAETGPQIVEDALREASRSSRSQAAQSFQSMISACSRAVRSVDGAAVTPADMKGKGWDARFSVRETHLLKFAYDKIHGTDGGAADAGEARPVSLS